MEHPWTPTLQEFLDRLRRERGIDLVSTEVTLGPRGEVRWDYARLNDPERAVVVSTGCAPEDRLTPTVLRSLCVRFGLPPDDWGLDPDPDD